LFLDPQTAVDQALSLVCQGADIIDVGGESTRPGADPVTAVEELKRVLPVIERLSGVSTTTISVDTTKSLVAREALAAGAHIVNDVSGLLLDPAMPDVCAAAGAGVICMHAQGTPRTMQIAPHYKDAVAEIRDYLANRVALLGERGITRQQIAVDPGIGFGKTAQHNLELLSAIGAFLPLGRPICIGHSRKRFLKKLVGREVDERVSATIGVSVALALQGADILRVHDVAATRDALLACLAVLEGRLDSTETVQ
jgi:dihydropteroate synthase